MVTASPLISADQTPTTDQLWALAYLLPANWSNGLTVTSAYRTSIRAARSVAEQRWQLAGKPSRLVRAPHLTFNADQALSLRMAMARASFARSLFPLYCDTTRLTAGVADSATVLPCDARYRRFYAGGRVAVYRQVGGRVTVYAVATIDAGGVADDALTLTAPVGTAFAAGAKVVPLIESDLYPTEASLLTDRHLRATLEGFETAGASALDPTSTPGTAPSGFQTHDGHPILTLPVLTPPGAEVGSTRDGGYVPLGLGRVGDFYGDRGRSDYRLPVRFRTRETAWGMLRFFDSRAGRCYPFWSISPFSGFTVSAISSTTVSVAAVGPVEDWQFVPYLAVILNDGTVYIRGVDEVNRSDDVDVVTFDTALPVSPSLDQVRRVRSARLSRFAMDELVERWRTSEVMETELQIVELLEEKDITIANLDRPASTGLTEAFAPGVCPGGDAGEPPSDNGCADCSGNQINSNIAKVSGLTDDFAPLNDVEMYLEAGPTPIPSGGCLWEFSSDLFFIGNRGYQIALNIILAGEGGDSFGNDPPCPEIFLDGGEYGLLLSLGVFDVVENTSFTAQWNTKLNTIYCGVSGVFVGSQAVGSPCQSDVAGQQAVVAFSTSE